MPVLETMQKTLFAEPEQLIPFSLLLLLCSLSVLSLAGVPLHLYGKIEGSVVNLRTDGVK